MTYLRRLLSRVPPPFPRVFRGFVFKQTATDLSLLRKQSCRDSVNRYRSKRDLWGISLFFQLPSEIPSSAGAFIRNWGPGRARNANGSPELNEEQFSLPFSKSETTKTENNQIKSDKMSSSFLGFENKIAAARCASSADNFADAAKLGRKQLRRTCSESRQRPSERVFGRTNVQRSTSKRYERNKAEMYQSSRRLVSNLA